MLEKLSNRLRRNMHEYVNMKKGCTWYLMSLIRMNQSEEWRRLKWKEEGGEALDGLVDFFKWRLTHLRERGRKLEVPQLEWFTFGCEVVKTRGQKPVHLQLERSRGRQKGRKIVWEKVCERGMAERDNENWQVSTDRDSARWFSKLWGFFRKMAAQTKNCESFFLTLHEREICVKKGGNYFFSFL